MTKLNQYFYEYSLSHQNPVNKKIHLIAVPAITLSVIGLLMAIPTPSWFPNYINWSSFFILGALSFYFSLRNFRLSLVVILFLALQIAVLHLMKPNLAIPCSTIFIVAWIAQFYGHHLEGRKPAFFRDLFFLMIGPLWVLHSLKLIQKTETGT